jgi:hypothetical protein
MRRINPAVQGRQARHRPRDQQPDLNLVRAPAHLRADLARAMGVSRATVT